MIANIYYRLIVIGLAAAQCIGCSDSSDAFRSRTISTSADASGKMEKSANSDVEAMREMRRTASTRLDRVESKVSALEKEVDSLTINSRHLRRSMRK